MLEVVPNGRTVASAPVWRRTPVASRTREEGSPQGTQGEDRGVRLPPRDPASPAVNSPSIRRPAPNEPKPVPADRLDLLNLKRLYVDCANSTAQRRTGAESAPPSRRRRVRHGCRPGDGAWSPLPCGERVRVRGAHARKTGESGRRLAS